MARNYKGSLSLEWYNKQRSILLKNKEEVSLSSIDIPAPTINWVNKDEALFYEFIPEEGRGLTPFWVDVNDIRVKEARPLMFQKVFRSIEVDQPGTLPGTSKIFTVQESPDDDSSIENTLIKGDNLLALNTIKKRFENKRDDEKVKCIYIDPPYNTGSAFENYDDSLAHSEWLTMMRDRLILLRDLLQESGTIFISIDNNESCYLQVLMDSVFGRQNRKNNITIKRGAGHGAKVINPGLVNVSEFILVYSKNTEVWTPKRLYKSTDRSDRYNNFIINYEENFAKWRFCPLSEAFAQATGVSKKELKNVFGDDLENKIDRFVFENSERVIRFAILDEKNISKDAREIKKVSTQDASKVFLLERENKSAYYVYKGQLILFAKDRLMEIDGKLTFSEPLTDIWDDVLPNDLHNEGGVDFKKGKKPEKMIQRIIEMSTSEGDLVLDCFGGSGSTFGVAHKMGRKWIGIEVGHHADTHIIPRLKSVLSGNDSAGITSSTNWKGGGSFKYYHLGPSIIVATKDGVGDFNWSLGKQFIQENLLLSYDYVLDEAIDFQADQLFPSKQNYPTIGVQRLGNKTRVAIVSLNEPNGRLKIMSYEEIQVIYRLIKSRFAPDYTNIFTNRGVEIAFDSKPDDLEIIKVPHAIFAELEK